MLIGVDWGGTKIEVIALADAGKELARTRAATPWSDYDGCLDLIAATGGSGRGVGRRRGNGGGRTAGLAGPADPDCQGSSSTWLNGHAVEDDLRRVLGREVRTSNDADCFAVSEATDGAGAGHRVVFGVILGTGAGAGIAVDGRAHHGPNYSAGEWGHNVLPRPDVSRDPGSGLLLRQARLPGALGLRSRRSPRTICGMPMSTSPSR